MTSDNSGDRHRISEVQEIRCLSPELSLLRPQNALVFLGDGPESFKYETLHALSAVGFSGVDIAFGIGSDAMHSVEFPGLAAAFTERGRDRGRVASQIVHAFILAVG